MRNIFMKVAISKASRLMGKPGRLLRLAAQLSIRLLRTRPSFSPGAWRERFALLGRLIKAYVQGKYRALPTRSLLSVVAAVLYFMNPFDLIPDALPAIGLGDDLAILTWVYRTCATDLENFVRWERSQLAMP